MSDKTARASFTQSITVQPNECEEFVVVSVRFLQSLRDQIDGLRAELGMPVHQWESPEDVRLARGRAGGGSR